MKKTKGKNLHNPECIYTYKWNDSNKNSTYLKATKIAKAAIHLKKILIIVNYFKRIDENIVWIISADKFYPIFSPYCI